jgi:nucleotide-binding universal stress UspA family protein
MRVLLATDGSPQAQTSEDLIADLDWPDETTFRVLTVIEPFAALYGAPWAPALPSHVDRLEAELVANGESIMEATSRAIARTGHEIERRLVRGRPASSIVDEAAEWPADLLVMGSRGHGAIAAMLLGSVSAEVVDHAPCPVLIARRSTLTRVVLGHDGSTYAVAAEQLLARWPIFERVAIEVASVAQVGAPWRSGTAPSVYGEAAEAHHQSAEMSTAEHARIAEESVRRLQEAGRRASAVVVAGDPAASLVRVADDHHADLVVVGTHGRTGFTRVLLGSVARNVMQHSAASVLIVRSPRDDRSEDHALEAGIGAGPTD